MSLTQEKLDLHVEQRIGERANLRHNMTIEHDEEDDAPRACLTGRAPASIWRAVREAIDEAGWRIVRKDQP